MLSPLSGLAAAVAAERREAAVDIPCMCVGPPAISRSAASTRSRVASLTGITVASNLGRRPSAMLSATRRVFPYIDS
ncbi:MAG TPA: hypothetical protein VKU39_12040 [Streptosporangiaceae bacterium]|nr:hypothetical protein [Streptosporangiaceae bacterium]